MLLILPVVEFVVTNLELEEFLLKIKSAFIHDDKKNILVFYFKPCSLTRGVF